MSGTTDNECVFNEIERTVQQKFRFRSEILFLMASSEQRNLQQLFDDVLFFAKFLSNAKAIIQREGSSSENVQKLLVEIRETTEKIHTLLRTLIKDSSEQMKEQFVKKFLTLSPECLEALFDLTKELTLIKNYQLDHAV